MSNTTRRTITFSTNVIDTLNKKLEGISLSSSSGIRSSSLLFSILNMSAEVYISQDEIVDVTFKTNLRRFESNELDFVFDVGNGRSSLFPQDKDSIAEIKKKYMKSISALCRQLVAFISVCDDVLFLDEDAFIHHLLEKE